MKFLVCILLSFVVATVRADWLAGADISMLPEFERAGGVYRENGKPADAISILRDHGVNLFRIRLFVNPSKDFNASWGATQEIESMLALAKRIKALGANLLLDLHYSDTWADPQHQAKPKEWENLSFDDLVLRVHDYTADVLKHFAEAGVAPDMVQIGNEITGGILWPDGKVLDAAKDEQPRQWKSFAALLNAGSRAVREASTPDHPIRIVLHIHGGGHKDLPMWFFKRITREKVDFDVIALSFYPTFSDSLNELRRSTSQLAREFDKDILIAEVAYPWSADASEKEPAMRWPSTPEGQKQFLIDLRTAVREIPNSRGIGVVWWYPEAIPAGNLHIWKNGRLSLFDRDGKPLPAIDSLKQDRDREN